MTYAQHAALVDVHAAIHDPKRRGRRGRVEDAVHGDIAALKEMKVASG